VRRRKRPTPGAVDARAASDTDDRDRRRPGTDEAMRLPPSAVPSALSPKR